jgi:hypothetical protein
MPNRILQGTRAAVTTTGISQDNIIFGMLLLAFVIFITIKGELPTYMGFFTPSKSQGPAAVPVTVGSVAPGSPAGSQPVGTPTINIPFIGPVTIPIPGLTTLSPGATGITQQPNGQQILNPGQPFSFSGFLSSLGNFFGGQGVTGTSTGTGTQ